MAAAPILGPVAFSGFEVPERISLGGKQKLVIHTLPGGTRVVDAMGPDDAAIRWSGVFSGSNAADRVRTLERLRRGGNSLQLSWDSWRYQVIIQQFDAEIENASWIPYKIELCVLSEAEQGNADWLTTARAPALTVAPLSGAALDQQVQSSGDALSGGTLSSLVSAAGVHAQYVTSRAYEGGGG